MSGPFTTMTNETTDGGLDLVSTVFATAVQPVATPTAVTGTQGAPQTLPVVATAGDPLVPLDPVATRLEAPEGATVDADGTVVVVPGEGRYELDRASGTVTFTPEPAFTGTATPVPYVLTDAAGATATSTLTPTVTAVATPDTSTGVQGVAQRLAVTDNDGGAVSVDPATLRLVGPNGQDATTVVVPGEGTWTVDGAELVFTPEPDFVGTATPVSYRVDTLAGDVVESTATPTVTAAPVVPPVPVPVVTVPDVVVTPPAGAPAVFDLPAAVPDVVPESVVLIQPNEAPATEVTTDEGTWQVQPTTGEVVFTPSPTLVGDPDPITFAAERTDGTDVTGRLVVDYVVAAGPAPTPAPAASADAAASSGALAFTGSDAGATSAAALIGATALLAGLGLTLAGRRRLRRQTGIRASSASRPS